MMIDEWQLQRKADAMRGDKEIKVKIPLDYHIKLHTVKVVKGQNISETVTAALARYFSEIRDGPTARPETAEQAVPAAPPRT